jgi:modulator of FtsH protease
MYDLSKPFGWEEVSTAQRQSVLGRVLGLLGVAFVCTAIGAFVGTRLGPGAFLISLIGSIGTLIALHFAREKSPANLWLMYAFATFEGMALGLIVESYLRSGMWAAVANAAVTTGVVTLAAGTYGYTTKRDLSGMGTILGVGLLALIVASIVGIFVGGSVLSILIGAVGAVLFTGFIMFDLNRVAQAKGVTEGETIMLAVSVYLDIFNLFLMLLRLFGIFGSSDD